MHAKGVLAHWFRAVTRSWPQSCPTKWFQGWLTFRGIHTDNQQ